MREFLNIHALSQYQSLDFIAKSIVEGFMHGLHRSPYKGFSVEYAEHRIYNPGESTRHIDWKIFAKTDRLYTKSYDAETNLRAYVVLDVSSSMYYPVPGYDKIKFSVYTSAALSYLLQKQRDSIGLFTFNEQIQDELPAQSTTTHTRHLLTYLDKIVRHPLKHKSTALAKAIHHIATKIPRRSLVIIFSDLLMTPSKQEAVYNALHHLRYKQHEVVLFHVTDKATEEELKFADRPHVFYDLETQGRVSLNPSKIREQYQKQRSSWQAEVETRCGLLGVTFFQVDVEEPFAKSLLTCLMKRSEM